MRITEHAYITAAAVVPSFCVLIFFYMSRLIRFTRFTSSLKNVLQFLASMPCAIALLCLIALVSIMGTILKQQQNYVDYVNRFGAWWTDVFIFFDLHQIYGASWFLCILAFLCLSTSICIIRTWPGLYRHMRQYQLNVQRQNLRAQSLYAHLPTYPIDSVQHVLRTEGFSWRIKHRQGATLIAAKKHAWQKWGYLLTHVAILVIALGGLLDGNLPMRWQLYTQQIQTVAPNQSHWLPNNWLSSDNPSFRANMTIHEGDQQNAATIQTTQGMLGQKLPFNVELKKFHIDYYSTGMPKRFVSDVVVTQNGQVPQRAQISVNQPLNIGAYSIYQSGFEDGGSSLVLKPIIWQQTQTQTQTQNAQLGQNIYTTTQKPVDVMLFDKTYRLEISEFKSINVQNQQKVDARSPTTSNDSSLPMQGMRDIKSLNSVNGVKHLKNIGPSLQYKIRDNNNQAKEFHTYMLPVMIDQTPYFVVGMRKALDQPFGYVYIPSQQNSMQEWLRMLNALQNSQIRQQAVRNYAARYPKLEAALVKSGQALLDSFNGYQQKNQLGFTALIDMAPKNGQQPEVANAMFKLLHGLMMEVRDLARIKDGLAPVQYNPSEYVFLQNAVNALSDIGLLEMPVWWQLSDFTERTASTLQITKSPGQAWVYLGCLMLILGVTLMLYIEPIRVWILLEKDQTHIAMQKGRQKSIQEQIFARIKASLSKS